MAKRRYVSDSFWSDTWIENLDPLEKYLYLYLITNQLVSVCWIYEIQTKRMAYETGIDKEMILKMLGRFQEEWKVYYKDWLIFIVNFVKNQSVTSTDDNLWKWIEREIKELWSDKMAKITQIEGAYKVVEGAYKDVAIPYFTLLNFTLPSGDAPPKKVIKKIPPKKKTTFSPPTITEVEQYFTTSWYSIASARKAWTYYDSAWWIDSNWKKVLNWKQKMISVRFKEENKQKQWMKTLTPEEIAERTQWRIYL